MRNRFDLIKISSKSFLKKNRGNVLLVVCIVLLLIFPTILSSVSQSVIDQVAASKMKVFGSFTDVYYQDATQENATLALSAADLSQLLPGFHYSKFGVLSTVYQEKLNQTKTLQLGYVDETARALGDITLVEGDLPDSSNEIALTQSMTDALGKNNVGDTVVILDTKYKISGILLDFGYLWPKRQDQSDTNSSVVNALVTKSEADRIYQRTGQLTRQILIVRQIGVSNPSENDSNLLRNTNNVLENTSNFKIPQEFVTLMMVAMMMAVLMILMLNRNNLIRRSQNYHYLGLCLSDIRFMIRFEIIFLGSAGTLLGIAIGLAISKLLMLTLPIFADQSIPFAANWRIIIVLSTSAIAAMMLMAFFYSRYILKCICAADHHDTNRYAVKTRKFHLAGFQLSINRRMLLILVAIVMLSFCELSFGIFYGRYFCADLYNQADGKLPKDFDCLFYSKVLPSSPASDGEAPVYFTDTYEHLGADDSFIKSLRSLPQVADVKSYKEINKMNVLIKQAEVDDYIDAHDYFLDGQYSMDSQTGIADVTTFQEKFGYQQDEILVGAEILTYPSDVLSNLESAVTEGKINYDKIASGEEVVLRVPAYKIKQYENGMVLKSFVPSDQEGALNSSTFHVGDTLHLSGILTDKLINGPVMESQADLFYRKDIYVKIGAIIRSTDGLFSSSGSFGKAFSILTLDSALSSFGLDADYSNVSIYAMSGYSTDEISQAIGGLSSRVPNMVFVDFQQEVKTYKIYRALTNLYVASFLIILITAAVIAISSLLLTMARLNMGKNALLRINGLSLVRLIQIWLLELYLATVAGCLVGMPVSLAILRYTGHFPDFDVLNQITYYFPLDNFLYLSLGMIFLLAVSACPSILFYMKQKNNVV